MDPQQRLQELIDASEALKTLPEEEKNEKIKTMMASTPEQILQLISVFEEEQARLTKIDEEFLTHEGEVIEFADKANAEKRNKDREERAVKETAIKQNDEKYAEDLLKKLDQIV